MNNQKLLNVEMEGTVEITPFMLFISQMEKPKPR